MKSRNRGATTKNFPLIIDGGTGSELTRRGVSQSADCWTAAAAITHFDTLVSVHADFIAAGADVVVTNTFATHRYVLEAGGLDDKFESINRAAVAAAQQARDSSGSAATIAGSMSCMPPQFNTSSYPSEPKERAAYRELAELLATLGVDVLALEMIQDPRRGALILEAALATGLPVWLGVSCQYDRDRDRLVGFDLREIAFTDVIGALTDFGPDVVNIMHTPISALSRAVAETRTHWDGPLGVYPELGSFDPVSRTRSREMSPKRFGSGARAWLDDGACLVGGCCGATPDHIKALRQALVSAPSDSAHHSRG